MKRFLSYREWLENQSRQFSAYLGGETKKIFFFRRFLIAVILLFITASCIIILMKINNPWDEASPELYLLIILAFLFSFSSVNYPRLDPFGRNIISGAKLMYYTEIDTIFQKTSNEVSVNVVGLTVPANLLNNHLFIMGQSGSGKTLLLCLLLNSIAQRMVVKQKVRALVHDFGFTLYPGLQKTGLDIILFMLNEVQQT
jgi:Type IV secretion-system coupling protein DNA-binding domain